MGNQYSEQYYIEKISDLEDDIEKTRKELKSQTKVIKNLNSKLDLVTMAMDALIQKSKKSNELIDSLTQFKDFFESNTHIFNLEEYDSDYNENETSSDEDSTTRRKQPTRKCKHKPGPVRIQPRRSVKKTNQPKSVYR